MFSNFQWPIILQYYHTIKKHFFLFALSLTSSSFSIFVVSFLLSNSLPLYKKLRYIKPATHFLYKEQETILGHCIIMALKSVLFFFLVVNCSDPGIPANSIRESKIEHGNFTYGTVVFYDCNPGYFLFGSSVLICQPNGHWDKPLPECISKQIMSLLLQRMWTRQGIMYPTFSSVS